MEDKEYKLGRGPACTILVSQLFGGMTGPFVVGLLSDKLGGWAQGMQGGLTAVTFVGIIGIVLIVIVMKFYPSDSAKVSDVVMAE